MLKIYMSRLKTRRQKRVTMIDDKGREKEGGG
jgi:hypothetical protein